MKKNFSTILKFLLAVGDLAIIIGSFAVAYYYRIHFDNRAYAFVPNTMEFIKLAAMLSPFLLIVFALFGLYKKNIIFYSRIKEYVLVVMASIVSVVMLVFYEFITYTEIFPTRIVAVYFIIINSILMIIAREIIKLVYHVFRRHGIGIRRVVIIGDKKTTATLAEFYAKHQKYGYDIVGIAASTKYLPADFKGQHFVDVKDFLAKKPQIDVIIQTDEEKSDEVCQYAVENFIRYSFVPLRKNMLSRIDSMWNVESHTIINTAVSKLDGWGRFVKRLFDIILGCLAMIIAAPVMLVVAVIMKIFEPSAPIIFSQKRLTIYDRKFNIYKFRTIKQKYNGLTPEEAFAKMGRPELATAYRKNGDQIDDDPRFTKIGRILRATSLDELPQILNVLKGDMSLVGPRALIPQELENHKNKSSILSVKSGVTGMAQVYGRRDISFEERRRLDLCYVQQWSLLLDIKIILKTVTSVLLRIGAS